MAAQYIPIKRISTLDTPIKAEKLDGSLFTTENQAHEFIISVRKNGVKQTATGSVSGKFIRANGTTIFLQGSIVDGDAVVRLHQDCYNVQGRFTFNIFNTQSGVTTCIYSAVGKIDMGSTETVIDAGDVVPDVADVVAKQEEMTQVIADARTATTAANTAATNVGSIVARPYSPPYKAGEHCTQNGNLYKAKQDIPSDEEWTASHWTQTVVGDELTDLKSALTDNIGAKIISFTSGGYIQCNTGTANIDSPNVNNNYRYAVVPCTAGDTFIVSAKGASAGRAWAFANASKTVLAVADASVTVSNLYLTAPQNSAYLIINDNNTGVQSYYGPLIKDVIQNLSESVEDIKGEYSDADLWESGTISITTGSDSASPSRLRTKNYINENISKVFTETDSVYVFYLLAWSKSGTYIGGWNGTSFGKDASYVYLVHELDIKELSKKYPDYIFKLIARKTTNSNISESEGKEYKFAYRNYVEHDSLDIIKKDFEYGKSYGVGLCWDWWLKANTTDIWGNEYIGFVDENANVGVMKRNADGSCEYKTLGKSYNNDDHNGLAVLLLADGRLLCIGAGGHGVDNRVLVYRSKEPYSISDFDDFSFTVTDRNNYKYRLTYSQPFYYNGKIFNFMRCHTLLNNSDDATGYICLMSSDNGDTWTEYTAFVNQDAYITFSVVSGENGLLRFIAGNNPATYGDTKFYGGFVDLATEKITNLSDTEIGSFAILAGSVNVQSSANYSSMTELANQRDGSKLGRLFTCAVTPKASTVFLMAHSDDASSKDFTYELYSNGTVIPIGKSGVPFGNNHYTSGICFGCTENHMYYSKALTNQADGAHELHMVKVNNGAIQFDEIIHTSAICMIRPLYCGSGDVLVNIGKYNDQNTDGTYNSSFVNWNLSPLFIT